MADHRIVFGQSQRLAYRIPGKRHIYLDTSVVRRLGTKMWHVPRLDETYTSVLTLIELLNGITKTERDFRLRRSAIAGVMGGDVAVDWQMPQFRLRCAFGTLRPKYDIYETRAQSIQAIVAHLAETETLPEFVATEPGLKLEHDLQYFCESDHSISRTFIAAATKWIPLNREQFATPAAGDFLEYIGLPRNLTLPEIAEALGGSDFDCGFGLYALARQFSAEEETLDCESHDRIFRSYDGSLDLFLRAMSHQLWREIGRAEMPGRNTGADLTHLQYVASGSIVATEDGGMREQIIGAGGTVLSAEELVAA